MAAAVLGVSSVQAGHLGSPSCISGFCNSASGWYTTAGTSNTGNVTVSQQLPPFGLFCASVTGWWASPTTGIQSQTYPSDPSTCNNITLNVSKTFSFPGVGSGDNFYEGSATVYEWIGGPSPWRPYDLNTPTVSIFIPPPPPPTADIKANGSDGPVNVVAPTTVTLSWSSTNATDCSSNGDAGTFGRGLPTSGSVSLSVGTAGTYSQSITCWNVANAWASDSVTVNVAPPPPPAPQNLRITPSPTQRHGDTGTISWDPVSGATSYTFFSSWPACAGGCPLAGTQVGPVPNTPVGPGTHSVWVAACNTTCGNATNPVSVTIQSNDAAFVSQNVPNTARPGVPFTATVTFRNTGQSTWDAPGQYVLRSEVGSFEVAIAPGVASPTVVAPTQTVTFSGPITIDSPGTYQYQWRMYRKENNFGFFGQSGPLSTIVVGGPVSAVPIRVQLQIRAKQHLPIQ